MIRRCPRAAYGGVSAEERVADRRARLLEAGLECFGTAGSPATGVKDVCRAAGLTDRYFYESFKDGRALFLAVFDDVTDALFGAVAEAVLAVAPDAGGPAARRDRDVPARARRRPAPRPRRLRRGRPPPGPRPPSTCTRRCGRFAALVDATARAHLPAGHPGGDVARARAVAGRDARARRRRRTCRYRPTS